jgi:hypothetical protein
MKATALTLAGWRRPISGALILVPCGWLIAFAMHLHVAADTARL